MSALWPVQKAAVARWRGAPAVMDRVTEFYAGRAPDTAVPSYVILREKTERPGPGAFGAESWADTLAVSIYTLPADNSDRAALEILDEMDAAVEVPLVLDRHQAARLKREFTATLQEGKYWRAEARYRITTWSA